jgi:hypothetical protein
MMCTAEFSCIDWSDLRCRCKLDGMKYILEYCCNFFSVCQPLIRNVARSLFFFFKFTESFTVTSCCLCAPWGCCVICCNFSSAIWIRPTLLKFLHPCRLNRVIASLRGTDYCIPRMECICLLDKRVFIFQYFPKYLFWEFYCMNGCN